MFIGHFAVGLALKRVAPRTSLGMLIAAPQLPDLLWPIFLLLGWEQVRIDPGNTAFTPLAFDRYPISHSLLMAAVWGGVLAAVVFWRAGRSRAAAAWIAAAVVSHWVLDWITHRPDMPIAPGLPLKVGLGLWNHVAATVMIEGVMFAAGVALYLNARRATSRRGAWGFWLFVALLAAIYAGNLFGPPPPDARAVAFVTLGLWLFPFWAAWLDRHHTARNG